MKGYQKKGGARFFSQVYAKGQEIMDAEKIYINYKEKKNL